MTLDAVNKAGGRAGEPFGRHDILRPKSSRIERLVLLRVDVPLKFLEVHDLYNFATDQSYNTCPNCWLQKFNVHDGNISETQNAPTGKVLG